MISDMQIRSNRPKISQRQYYKPRVSEHNCSFLNSIHSLLWEVGKGIGDVPHLGFIWSAWIINKTSFVNCNRADRTENTLVLNTLIQAVEAKYFCLKTLCFPV